MTQADQIETMSALRVVAEGPVTSFRYPHFVQGTQPTYEMPPPATLYGHVCSTLGELVDFDAFRLAVVFMHSGKFVDYEHTYMAGNGVKLSPTRRELLFQPRLTLYLDRPEWLERFRSPHYVVTLGRSQDLMRYTAVEIVILRRATTAYVEHSLLPLKTAALDGGVESYTALALPRRIDDRRHPQWGQYAMVQTRQFVDPIMADCWIDPDTKGWRGAQRAVTWLTF